MVGAAAMREAAVLVPIVARAEEASILLTTRSAALRKHSGQIAFPGGAVDPGDGSPEAAALREAEETLARARAEAQRVAEAAAALEVIRAKIDMGRPGGWAWTYTVTPLRSTP